MLFSTPNTLAHHQICFDYTSVQCTTLDFRLKALPYRFHRTGWAWQWCHTCVHRSSARDQWQCAEEASVSRCTRCSLGNP